MVYRMIFYSETISSDDTLNGSKKICDVGDESGSYGRRIVTSFRKSLNLGIHFIVTTSGSSAVVPC